MSAYKSNKTLIGKVSMIASFFSRQCYLEFCIPHYLWEPRAQVSEVWHFKHSAELVWCLQAPNQLGSTLKLWSIHLLQLVLIERAKTLTTRGTCTKILRWRTQHTQPFTTSPPTRLSILLERRKRTYNTCTAECTVIWKLLLYKWVWYHKMIWNKYMTQNNTDVPHIQCAKLFSAFFQTTLSRGLVYTGNRSTHASRYVHNNSEAIVVCMYILIYTC